MAGKEVKADETTDDGSVLKYLDQSDKEENCINTNNEATDS